MARPQVHGRELLAGEQRERGLLVGGRVAVRLLLLPELVVVVSVGVVEGGGAADDAADEEQCRGEESSRHRRYLGERHQQSATGTCSCLVSSGENENQERCGRSRGP